MKTIRSIVLLFLPLVLSAQNNPVKLVKLDRFLLQSSAVISETGKELSSAEYIPTGYWFPVKVPSTVLSGLVRNNIYADPYSGMNNMLIPDASDSFNHQYHLEQYSYLPNESNPWKKPYWYRSFFSVPEADTGKRFQLIFKGINYGLKSGLTDNELPIRPKWLACLQNTVLMSAMLVIAGKKMHWQ